MSDEVASAGCVSCENVVRASSHQESIGPVLARDIVDNAIFVGIRQRHGDLTVRGNGVPDDEVARGGLYMDSMKDIFERRILPEDVITATSESDSRRPGVMTRGVVIERRFRHLYELESIAAVRHCIVSGQHVSMPMVEHESPLQVVVRAIAGDRAPFGAEDGNPV